MDPCPVPIRYICTSVHLCICTTYYAVFLFFLFLSFFFWKASGDSVHSSNFSTFSPVITSFACLQMEGRVSLASKATMASMVRVCAGPLSFFCPKTKACLFRALTVGAPAPCVVLDGIMVLSIAGVTLISYMPITGADTLTTVRKKVDMALHPRVQ